jgi:hypothetical protein
MSVLAARQIMIAQQYGLEKTTNCAISSSRRKRQSTHLKRANLPKGSDAKLRV